MTDLAHNLAHNLTALRKQRQLSQAQLAGLAEIPRSTITHMESGAGNPSLSNLARVASALKLSIEDLLARPRNEIRLLGKDQVPTREQSDGAVKLVRLLPDPPRDLRFDRLEMAGSTVVKSRPHARGTVEYLHVVRGQLQVTVAGGDYPVASGEVLQFPADQPHVYRNPKSLTVVAVSLVLPRPFD
ncbi:MAG: XRE family transcriptional regulator [Xanthomonadales bacterium]|nr:XRE family transcriptional regulator [Xanthomonadales bacterium]